MIYFIIGGIVVFAAGFVLLALSRQRDGWHYCRRCRLYYNIAGDRTDTPPHGLTESELDFCPICQWETQVHRGACGKYRNGHVHK